MASVERSWDGSMPETAGSSQLQDAAEPVSQDDGTYKITYLREGKT